jgi:alkylation response protein AidB-like acyl-CoA dehydrogenase
MYARLRQNDGQVWKRDGTHRTLDRVRGPITLRAAAQKVASAVGKMISGAQAHRCRDDANDCHGGKSTAWSAGNYKKVAHDHVSARCLEAGLHAPRPGFSCTVVL